MEDWREEDWLGLEAWDKLSLDDTLDASSSSVDMANCEKMDYAQTFFILYHIQHILPTSIQWFIAPPKISKLNFTCKKSKTITNTPNPTTATELFLLAFYAMNSNITSPELQWYTIPMRQNIPSTHRTCEILFRECLEYELTAKVTWILNLVTIKQAILLAHFNSTWVETYIQLHFKENILEIKHIARIIQTNIDIYCYLLHLLQEQDWTWILIPNVPIKWNAVFLHKTPSAVFRAIKGYPTQKTWNQFHLHSLKGSSPSIHVI